MLEDFTNQSVWNNDLVTDNSDSVSSLLKLSSCHSHAGMAAWLALAGCDSPVAAPGSSPPAGIPSASSAPQCSRDALPPAHGIIAKTGQKRPGWSADDLIVSLIRKKVKKKVEKKAQHKPKPLSQTQRWTSTILKQNCRERDDWIKRLRRRRDGEWDHQRTEWKRKRALPALPSMSSSHKCHAAVPRWYNSQSRIPVHTLATKH